MIKRKKIAIIGTGISGVSAAYHLNKYHDITIFDKNEKLGGHTHTVQVGDLNIDMGFIVFNEPCYPNLIALFKELNIEHQESNMSFSASINEGELEYSSLNMFAQKLNILRPRYWKIILDILRFYKQSPLDVTNKYYIDLTIGEYLILKKYSKYFIEEHLIPQASAIWSCSADEILDYPFVAFLRFFENHGLLEINMEKRVKWRTVNNGSHTYLNKIMGDLKNKIIKEKVISVDNKNVDTVNKSYVFDEIIFACHSDEALEIIKNPTKLHKEILGAIKYTPNKVVLHTDESLMPVRIKAWASWNYLTNKSFNKEQAVCVTYWMNMLQNLKSETNYFVSLNPIKNIDETKIIKTMNFDHPLFNSEALHAQQRMNEIEGKDNLWFCGAYMGSGFHEDGIQAGLMVAEAISGIKRNWDFDWKNSRIPQNLKSL